LCGSFFKRAVADFRNCDGQAAHISARILVRSHQLESYHVSFHASAFAAPLDSGVRLIIPASRGLFHG
jgi:hypothetical protein